VDMDWYMEGEYIKACNCDPGCPCDFNQAPTNPNCEGLAAMKITKGHYGDISLDGLHWAGVVYWPGRMDEGDGSVQPILDERATDEQRGALLSIMSGGAGDPFFEIMAAVCPHVKDPISAPFEWAWDTDKLTGRISAGAVLETDIEGIKGFGDPPPDYRIRVTIPGGFEYTGPDASAETAVATTLRSSGAITYEHHGTHANLAWVQHGHDATTTVTQLP
jgi:hypothetical protein